MLILSIIPSTSAFTTSQLLSSKHHHTHYDSTSTPTTALFAEESTTINTEQPLATKKIEEGSHDEGKKSVGDKIISFVLEIPSEYDMILKTTKEDAE